MKEDYTATPGDMLGAYYRVEESMGKGSFGQVVSAIDLRTNTRVAVKVIKNKEAFRRQARTEIRLLELLNRRDPEDNWCIGVWLRAAADARERPPACRVAAPPPATAPPWHDVPPHILALSPSLPGPCSAVCGAV